MLSSDTIERIDAYLRESIRIKRARRQRSDADISFDHLHAILTSCLVDLQDDESAANLLRLCINLRDRRERSCLASVLYGRIDLVALLSPKEG